MWRPLCSSVSLSANVIETRRPQRYVRPTSGAHPVNHQVHRRAPFVAHIAGHLFAGEDARGVHAAGGAARGARAAMGKRVAVRRWLTFEAPPLHHSLEALALAHALHIDVLAGDEVTRGDARANGKHRVLRHSELAHVTLERKVELLEHARLGAIQALALLPTSPELQSEESLFVLELLLHDLCARHRKSR
eukprot:2436680-Pleurochrysis_carterae.AAC.1